MSLSENGGYTLLNRHNVADLTFLFEDRIFFVTRGIFFNSKNTTTSATTTTTTTKTKALGDH